MSWVAEYQQTHHVEFVARLRRGMVLRAMLAAGSSQRSIAQALGVTQPAISQQLRSGPDTSKVNPATLLEAATPVIKAMAIERGYSRLAVFGSVARGDADPDSDIDLLVQAPDDASTFDFIRFQHEVTMVMGRKVDLIEYGGLKTGLDDDIRRDSIPL